MSTSEGNHGASEHAAEAHAPPALPEPQTPMWLPAVGALLFLTVGLVWAIGAEPSASANAPANSANTPANSAPPAKTAAPTPTPAATQVFTAQPVRQGVVLPGGHPGGAARPAAPAAKGAH